MKYLMILAMVLFCFALPAQSVNTERMHRDIKVAENILSSLIQERNDVVIAGRNYQHGGNTGVEGSYLEGFGVLFSIGSRSSLFQIGGVSGQFPKGSNGNSYSIVIPDVIAQSDKLARVRRRGSSGGVTIWGDDQDSITIIDRSKEVIETFVSEYGYLLRQLPSNEKLMIRTGGNPGVNYYYSGTGNFSFSNSNSNRLSSTFSASVKKSDIDLFEGGKISKEQLMDRIEYSEDDEQNEDLEKDLSLLSSIFSTLYQRNGEEIFYQSRGINVEKIEGLGAVVRMSIRLNGRDSDLFTIYRSYSRQNSNVPRAEEDEKKEEERRAENTQKIDSEYPVFLQTLKENIVEYGSIVKSLTAGEALLFKVSFFDCKECKELPEELEITAKVSTLESYKKGNTSLSQAITQLKVAGN